MIEKPAEAPAESLTDFNHRSFLSCLKVRLLRKQSVDTVFLVQVSLECGGFWCDSMVLTLAF